MDPYGFRPDNPAPEGTRDHAPGGGKVSGLDAQNLKDKFTNKKHTGAGAHADRGAPAEADLDIGKRFMPEGGMRSSNLDTTGHQTKGE